MVLSCLAINSQALRFLHFISIDQMKSSTSIILNGERLQLLSEKAIFWEAKAMLLIADLHLGKATHFRNNGIAVPAELQRKNWKLLHQLFQKSGVKEVCFLGDLFHSAHNKEWELFGELLEDYKGIEFTLVLGNHDILEKDKYLELGFGLVEELEEPPFIFTHEPLEVEHELYNLAGHIHPAVRMRGKGKQTQRVPCFYFAEHQGLLPAFGAFTGMANIKVKKDDQVYVVVKDQVIKV